MKTRNPHDSRGLTLVETMVTVAVAATLLGAAVPHFQDTQARHRLDSAVAQLETDLVLARSEAVMRNESVHVAFGYDVTGSCYVVHTGSSGDCSCTGAGSASCQGTAQTVRRAHLPADIGVVLRANSATMLFDAVRGTVTPTATIEARSRVGRLRAIVNIMGRVRTCAATPALPGHPPC